MIFHYARDANEILHKMNPFLRGSWLYFLLLSLSVSSSFAAENFNLQKFEGVWASDCENEMESSARIVMINAGTYIYYISVSQYNLTGEEAVEARLYPVIRNGNDFHFDISGSIVAYRLSDDGMTLTIPANSPNQVKKCQDRDSFFNRDTLTEFSTKK